MSLGCLTDIDQDFKCWTGILLRVTNKNQQRWQQVIFIGSINANPKIYNVFLWRKLLRRSFFLNFLLLQLQPARKIATCNSTLSFYFATNRISFFYCSWLHSLYLRVATPNWPCTTHNSWNTNFCYY